MKTLNDKVAEALARLCQEELQRSELEEALAWLEFTLKQLIARYQTEDWAFLRGKVLEELIKQLDSPEAGR